MGRLVAAGAEGLVAGAAENDDADVLVPTGAMKGVNDFFAGRAPEGVVNLGAVDGDRGDPAGNVKENVLVGHRRLSLDF
jgi:hypothetical protein